MMVNQRFLLNAAALLSVATAMVGCGCNQDANPDDRKLREAVKNTEIDMSKIPEKDRGIVEAMLNQGKNRRAPPVAPSKGEDKGK